MKWQQSTSEAEVERPAIIRMKINDRRATRSRAPLAPSSVCAPSPPSGGQFDDQLAPNERPSPKSGVKETVIQSRTTLARTCKLSALPHAPRRPSCRRICPVYCWFPFPIFISPFFPLLRQASSTYRMRSTPMSSSARCAFFPSFLPS
jgi:hypothetical protein